jgi:protein MAK11
MALIAGSYERFLFGFSHPASFRNKEGFELKSMFTYPAHKGVVKSLACGGPFVVSGGADDLIHLYDLKFEKDLGFLVNPGVGAITAMEFFTPKDAFRPTHLLAGCADGTLSVWSVGDGWQCMKTLRGHRHEVSSIAIHETGVLALTTSRDKTLRLWDLIKGRTTFQSKLEEEAEQVAFSPSGTMYALRSGRTVSVFRVGGEGSGKACTALEHSRRVTSFCFGNADDAIVTGTDDGVIRAWRVPDLGTSGRPSIVVELDGAHTSRIKAFAIPKSYTVVRHGGVNGGDDEDGLPEPESTVLAAGNFPAFVSSASSDGRISVWNLQDAVQASTSSKSPIQDASRFCLSSVNTKARLTTLCALDSPDMMEVKALELSMKNKSTKSKSKRKKKVDGRARADGTKTETKKLPKAPLTGPEGRKRRQQQLSQQERPKNEAVGVETVVHGTERVVSFLDKKDLERQRKREKRIEIQSKRKLAQSQARKKKS